MSDARLSGPAEEGKTANIIYILYLVAVIFGLTAIIGVVMAYINKGEAPAWLQSHYQFQIRTFWIGLLFSVVGVASSVILVGWLVLLFTLIWWIVRCVKGMKMLSHGVEHPDPTSWMFG